MVLQNFLLLGLQILDLLVHFNFLFVVLRLFFNALVEESSEVVQVVHAVNQSGQ